MAINNTFTDRYPSIPLSELDENFEQVDLAFNHANGSFTHANSAFATANTKLASAGGTLTGNLIFGDNVKIQLGNQPDLQIYHDGTNSYIEDTGAGYLILGGQDTGVIIQSNSGGNLLLTSGYDVALNYNGGQRLITTSTGIQVDKSIHIKSTDATNDETFILIEQDNGSGDLDSEKSYIDFSFVDGNANFTPQVRIGAEVGSGDGNASDLGEEGSGAFVVETALGITDGTGALNQNFRVNHTGNVTKPNHCAFKVYGDTNNTALTGTITWDQVSIDRGNDFDLTNNRFVAPVDGVYFFEHHNLAGNNGNVANDIGFYKNGAFLAGTRVRQHEDGTGWNTYNIASVLDMSAGDTLEVRVITGAVYHNSNSWTVFQGFLIG